jgi:hypothetical protein
MLSVDTFVYFAQNVVHVFLIDTLEEWDGFSSFVQFVVEETVRGGFSLN